MAARKPKTPAVPISAFFAAAAATVAAPATITPPAASTSTEKLTHTDPTVQAFYDSLTPAEIIAHRIAVTKLGTSYDVTRTHGFVRWNKARAEAAK